MTRSFVGHASPNSINSLMIFYNRIISFATSSLSWTACLAILTLMPSSLFAGALWNGTFESGLLSPWTVFQGPAAIGKTAHSGSYDLTMGPSGTNVIVYQQVSGLAHGQTYLVTAWVKSALAGASAELKVAGAAGSVNSSIATSTVWQQVSQSYTVGSNGLLTISLEQLASSSSMTTYWDDIAISALPPGNAGFESGLLAPWVIPQGIATVVSTAHSGRFGLTLGPASTQTIVTQEISGLVAGQTYIVSAWVKASTVANGGTELAVRGASGIVGSNVTPTTNWQQVTQTCVPSSDESITIYLAQQAYSSPVTTDWDDVTITAAGTPGTPGPNVLTYHNDLSRTGQNTNETILTLSNVTPATFGKLFTRETDGSLLAQPLYVTGQFIQASGFHNVVVGATEEESVYAFDADGNQGANANPLWHIRLIDSAHGGEPGETSAAARQCSFGPVNEGVTGTPVIDPSNGVLYVEAKSSLNGHVIHRLHAIDMTTGAEEPNWPVTLAGSVPGNGDGSVNGTLTFNPDVELSRPGLLLSGGGVYVEFASNGCDSDFGDVYHGWIFRFDSATAAGTLLSLTPNGHADPTGAPAAGGVWMSGAAPAADAAGNIFLSTSNGTFDTTLNANGMPFLGDYSDSILKISTGAAISIADYFTPVSELTLDDGDIDLGSGGVLLLPDQTGPYPHLLVEAGKEGTIRLVNRDQMNHFCGTCSADQVVQSLIGALPNAELGMPAYWNGHIYFGNTQDYIRSFSINQGLLSKSPTVMSTDTIPTSYGTTPSVSANGLNNGILWGIQSWSGPPDGNAVLKAWDALSLNSIYTSNNQFGTDDPGGYVEFTVPTVAHGKVYVGSKSNISVYGLLPAPRSSIITNPGFETGSFSQPWNSFIPAGGTGSFTVTSGALAGNYALEEGPNSSDEVAYQTVTGLTPRQSYVVSVWVTLSSGVPGTVFLYTDDTTGANACSTPPIAPASYWQQMSCVYTVTGNGAMNIHLVENAGSFSTYWDNISVTPVPPMNPSFETATLSAPWNVFIPSGGTGAFSISPLAAHSGSSSLLTGSNSNAEVAYQTVTSLVPGQNYLASAWVKLASGEPGTAFLYADDTTGANACDSPVITPAAEWQQIACIYTATSNQSTNIHLVENAGSFGTYWDDVALTPIPPVNGGFEVGTFSAPWNRYFPGGGGSLDVSSVAAHSGRYGLIEGPTSGLEAAYQTIYGLTPGQSYQLSAWVMLGSGNAGTVFLYGVDTLSGTYCATSLATPSAAWQEINCVYTATVNGAVLLFLAQNSGAFTTYWDDVAVIPLPPVNPGFENGSLKPWTLILPTGATGSITLSAAAARSGLSGLVEGPNSSGESASQLVEGLISGQNYMLSAWVKLASGTTGQAYLSVDDTSGANSCSTLPALPTAQWQQLSCVFTATSTQAMNIRLAETVGSITTYWDDVVIAGHFLSSAWGNFAPANIWINFLGYKW